MALSYKRNTSDLGELDNAQFKVIRVLNRMGIEHVTCYVRNGSALGAQDTLDI